LVLLTGLGPASADLATEGLSGTHWRRRSYLGALAIILAIRSHSMTFGKGLLLWLIGIPLPIILLLALFWHN
jgi:hypothetical protein